MKVVIVGAGAIGLCCAYYCAKAGAEVTVLDRRTPGEGASTTNAGWVVPTMSDPVPSPASVSKALRWLLKADSPLHVGVSLSPSYLAFLGRMLLASRPGRFDHGLRATARLNEETRAAYEELVRDGLDFDLHRDGVLYAFLDARAAAGYIPHLEAMTEFGNPSPRLVDADRIRVLEPRLGGDVKAGILCPDERHLDPRRFVAALVLKCRDMGVEIVDDETITHFECHGDQVTAARGSRQWRGDRFVLAAGLDSARLAGSVGLDLPMQGGRGYGYDVECAEPLTRRAIYLTDHKVALTPLPGRLRAAGTMEFGSAHRPVSHTRAWGIVTSTRHYLPAFEPVPDARPWSGMRPMTPDGLPAIGPASERSNLTVATGHAMLGITLAPVTGRAVAELTTGPRGAPVPPLLHPFAPTRFRRRPHRPVAPPQPPHLPKEPT
ncbi:NAD(P)/FAD-dependent oxidoreductase [Streptomyces sp. NPDC059627]